MSEIDTYKKQSTKIIKDLVDLQKWLSEELDTLKDFIFETILKKQAVSAPTFIDSRIETLIASYEAKEHDIRKQLVILYKKYKHLADFQEIVKTYEGQLKKMLNENKKKVKEISDEITNKGHRVSPLVFQKFVSLELDFDVLKSKYQKMANNPKAESDTIIVSKLAKALRKKVATFDI